MSDAYHSQTDAELLVECEIDTYCSSGPGGQNVNRRETAVRLTHLPTGLVVHCQKERSQGRNRQLALGQLRIRLWKRFTKLNRRRRVPTSIPRGVRERILTQKKIQSQIKQSRRRPSEDD